jgi:hypothetical protein
MSFYHPNIHRCEHIKANGTQCGSPSLRQKKLCFFHERWQQQRLAITDSVDAIPKGISIAPALNLPVLEDANSIQIAIMQILQLLLTGLLEHKTAALALYGLRAASRNLRDASFKPNPQNVVINPATVNKTLLGEDIWKNSDFNVKKEDKLKEDGLQEDRLQKENDDPKISPQEITVLALPEPSAVRTSEQMSEELPPNWKEELRTKIAARVRHAARGAAWINHMARTTKSSG